MLLDKLGPWLGLYAAVISTFQMIIGVRKWLLETRFYLRIRLRAAIADLGMGTNTYLTINVFNCGARAVQVTGWGIPLSDGENVFTDLHAISQPRLPAVIEPGTGLTIFVEMNKVMAVRGLRWPYHRTWVSDASGKRYYYRAALRARIQGWLESGSR